MPGLCPVPCLSTGEPALCVLAGARKLAQPREAELNLVVLMDSAGTARARPGLSHDLGASKLENETDPNFLPLELKQNLKARACQHRQRWRLSGGCLKGSQAWVPRPVLVVQLVSWLANS